jgi:hypothetical protein
MGVREPVSDEQLELPLDFGGPVVAEHEEALWAGGAIFDKVQDERNRQVEKWGEQNHPHRSTYPGNSRFRTPDYKFLGVEYHNRNDVAVQKGVVGWDTILLEEVFEALEKAGVDDDEYEKELVEVMAVAAAMIEANRRRRGVPHGKARGNR